MLGGRRCSPTVPPPSCSLPWAPAPASRGRRRLRARPGPETAPAPLRGAQWSRGGVLGGILPPQAGSAVGGPDSLLALELGGAGRGTAGSRESPAHPTAAPRLISRGIGVCGAVCRCDGWLLWHQPPAGCHPPPPIFPAPPHAPTIASPAQSRAFIHRSFVEVFTSVPFYNPPPYPGHSRPKKSGPV